MFTITIEDQNGQVADSFSFDHGSYVIGRLEKCDVVLPSSSVSREHARIFIEDDRCYVEDLGSANGVIVDGQRVVKTRDLGTASQIRVGDFYLYLEYQRPADRQKQDVLSTLFIDSGDEHHKLVRINDAFAGEEFSLSELENTIGRTDDNFILLSDSSISRHHAVLNRRADLYVVEDRGSSNGTRLNGKDVTGRKELKSGDVIEFGNVEFVFVEGNQSVNPAEFAGSVSSDSDGLVTYAGFAVLLLVGLAIGGAVVFGIFHLAQGGDDEVVAEAVDPLQAEVDVLLDDGRSHLEVGSWDAAATAFNQALDLSPENEEARELQERVDIEKQGAELLAEGEKLSEQGRHSEARRVLLDIPEDTRAAERAAPTLAHLDGTISHALRGEVRRLLRRGDTEDLLSAHEKAIEAYGINSDEELATLLDDVEDRLHDEDIEFAPALR